MVEVWHTYLNMYTALRSQLLQAAAQCEGGAMACMNHLSGDLVLIVLAV